MADHTKIEWADSTFNPWIGCTKVGPGCDHCYAERDMDLRRHRVVWGAGQARSRTKPANWSKPVRWNADGGEFYREHRRPRRVFCASLADVFDNEVPVEWRRDLFQLIGQTGNLEWLVLTKRIGNVLRMMREVGLDWPSNAALGFTVVNQAELNRDWRKAQSAAYGLKPRYLFASIEPMLGAMNLERIESEVDDWTFYDNALTGSTSNKSGAWEGPRLDWVIVGGESGPQARPMHPGWVRLLRDQCGNAGVPFLFKQWGEWAPTLLDEGTRLSSRMDLRAPVRLEDTAMTRVAIAERSDGSKVEQWWPVSRVGKAQAGRLLDGETHDGVPTP